MNRKEIEKVETTSIDITAEQKKQLQAIFPEVFAEDNIDFAKLKATLGNKKVYHQNHLMLEKKVWLNYVKNTSHIAVDNIG